MVLFLLLGWYHWVKSGETIPKFQVETLVNKNQGSVKIFGTDIDKPLKDFANDFNNYLENQNKLNRKMNQLAACGYFFAALTALVSMVVVIASLRSQ